MASFDSAEKFFFNPRLRIDGPPGVAPGQVFIPHRHLPREARVSRQHGVDSGDDDLRHSHRHRLRDQQHHRRDSLRNLRRIVGDKVTKSPEHLPQIASGNNNNKDDAASGADTVAKQKSGSVTALDRLPRVRNIGGKVTRLHRSNPSLGAPGAAELTSDKDADKPELNSMPAGLQYVGTDHATKRASLTSIHAKRRRSSRLPSIIISGQVRTGADLLSLGGECTDRGDLDIESETTSSEEAEDKVKSPSEATKMLEERQADEASAERDVQSDWVLQNEIDAMHKQFERRKKKLNIELADEDPMVVIEKRMQEIKQMTKTKRDQRQVLERFTPDVQNLILKYKSIPVSEIREKRGKSELKLVNRFRRAVNITRLLLRGFHGNSRYHLDNANVSELRKKMENMVGKSSSVATGRASISADMQLALSTQPHLRDRKQIKQILWMLRATKAFKHLFPAEMEQEVARMVSYERYDDGRVIAFQGRTPDRYYYILSGRVNLLRQYKLSTGQVTKSMGFLTKGYSTDPQEVDMQWMREDSLVCKGQVEVLLFDKKPFRTLQHTTDGPPLDFLQSLHLFLEFPVKRFLDTPDAIDVKYFGQGKIIARDSNRTPWIHVVKSGLVKVVRRQNVIDVRLSNDSKFTAPTADHLGCGKTFSHAQAMLGVQAKQKKVKSLKDQPVLPQIKPSGNGDNYRKHKLVKTSQKSLKFDDTIQTTYIQTPGTGIFRHSNSVDSTASSNDRINDYEIIVDESSEKETRDDSTGDKLSPAAGFEPHDLWLTREKTGHDVTLPTVSSRHREPPKRRAYLQLDVLRPGDVFGLDHLQQALASEPVGVSLLSDGAEVIKISKRFFLQNAENNTMLKVETMYKEYLSEEEARDVIYHRETWDQYKAALWGRVTAPSPIPAASKR